MNFKENGWEVVDWINLDLVGSHEFGNELLSCIKCEEFLN
jgi:hypothetical protein